MRSALALAPLAQVPDDARLAQRYYALVVPFVSLQDDVTLAEVQARWTGAGGPLLATEDAAGDLVPVLGAFQGETLQDWELLARLQADPQALGVLP